MIRLVVGLVTVLLATTAFSLELSQDKPRVRSESGQATTDAALLRHLGAVSASKSSKSKSKGPTCNKSKTPKSKTGKGGLKQPKKSKAPKKSKSGKSPPKKSKAPKKSKSGFECDEPATQAPTPPATCSLALDVSCETNEGLSCSLYPSCYATTSTISKITIEYVPNPCSESSNSQGTAASCDGTETAVGDPVLISCIDVSEDTIFVRRDVSSGDTITFNVPLVDDSGLVDCQVVGPTEKQDTMFQTDGSVALHAGDSFGSLRVTACDKTKCDQKVSLTYTATNDSTDAAVELSKFTVKTTGEPKISILSEVKTSLKEPGASTSTRERTTLDVCVDALSIRADVKGNVEGGDAVCSATHDHEFSA